MIYISGAITGTDDYMEKFSAAEEYLTNKGYIVINPAKVNAQMPETTTHEQYMEMSLTMLKMCDSIYMLSGWENSVGARFELDYAIENSFVVHHQIKYKHGVLGFSDDKMPDKLYFVFNRMTCEYELYLNRESAQAAISDIVQRNKVLITDLEIIEYTNTENIEKIGKFLNLTLKETETALSLSEDMKKILRFTIKIMSKINAKELAVYARSVTTP